MNTLIQSLNEIGSTFTSVTGPMFLQSSVLIILMLALDRVLRSKVSATVRHLLWLLVLAKLVLPPTLSSPTSLAYWLPRSTSVTESRLPAAGPMDHATSAALTLDGPVGPVQPRSMPYQARLTGQAWLLVAWLAGMVCLSAWVWRRAGLVKQMLNESKEAPEALERMVNSCREQLAIQRAISVRCSPRTGAPAICGLFRPVIIVPSCLVEDLGASEMRGVLLHELAHYRRGDLWIGHAQLLLQLIYWYNPLLWLANIAMRKVREQAVDEMVLRELRGEATEYPATLLRVARLTLARPGLSVGLIGIVESAGGLKERVERMVNHRLPHAWPAWSSVMLVFILGLIVLPMACKRKEAAADTNRPIDQIQTNLKLSPGETRDLEKKLQGDPQLKGLTIGEQQAAELEAKLKADPEAESVRRQLLGYYNTQQYKSDAARKARQEHVLWFIEHHPDVKIDGPFLRLDRHLDGAVYDRAKAVWLKQVQENPSNLVVLDNAADYCLIHDRQTAEQLWKKAQLAEPDNPKWAERLAQLYSLSANSAGGSQAASDANKALQEMEKAQASTPGDFLKLDSLAKMAFAAGEVDKARNYAKQLLEQAPAHRDAWNYGNAIHRGNLILGRIALREGDLKEAKRYLLEAGKTPGSPQLNSFGPNMSLAKELADKGETETVQAYFKMCAVFWKMGGARLDQWSREIDAGKSPDFGANLNF